MGGFLGGVAGGWVHQTFDYQTVFLAAAYQHVNDKPSGDFNGETLDSIFIQK